MGDVMQGIAENVRFNHGHADALIWECNDAADTIEGQIGSRSSWLSHGLEDFSGYYAQLFEQNGSVQASDASLVVTRLREVATAVGDLKAAAKAEQDRREKARAWKQRQDARGLWDHVTDWFTGGEAPPVGPPDPEPQFSVTTVTPQEREPLTGSGYSGVSSGRPANLRSFATNSSGGNDEIRPKASTAKGAYTNFVGSCGWGQLEASGVFSGFESYIAANDNDVHWAGVVADAFEAAGGSGVVTVANATLTAALEANGVNAQRADLEIDPPQAFGAPPTTGYANDPVNTATGNFLEPETDLAFDGGCSVLLWGRMYNSFNSAVGAFGPGWSSWTEAGLRVEESQAWWRLFDGREILFPREGAGWARATTEAFWLTATDSGHEIVDNAGGWWRFDAAGHLVGYAAGGGFAVSLTWVEGQLQRLEHERGRFVDLVWGEDRVVAAQASDGRRVGYHYDEGRLVAAVTARGTRRYEWDDTGLLCRVVDADGVVEVDNTYDPQGRVVTQASQHGRVSQFTYLPGHVTVVADEDGQRSNAWFHDAQGRLIRIVDVDGESTSLARDQYGNVVLSTERDGGITASQYDDRSRLVARQTPSGARIENTWDEDDRLLAVDVHADDGGPCRTSFVYDGDSRLPSAIVDGTGATTTLWWERGQLVKTVDPTGVELTISYDEHGDIVAMADGAGNTSRLERDAAGRITASITPSGRVTRYEWEGEHLAARIDPDGARWGFEYSAAGRLAATIDPLGARTVTTRGDSGEVAAVTDPLGRVTASFHDDLGNLAGVVLPDGRRWEYAHDGLSRLVAVTDPEGARWDYSHDVMGRPTRRQDPTGRAWVIGRSKDGCQTWEHPDIPQPPTTSQVTDLIGRIISVTAPEGGVNRTRYDQCGRPVEYIDADGNTTTLTRDPAGRVTGIHNPDGTSTSYSYDPATGRLVSVTDAAGNTTRFVTNPDNQLVVEINPLGEEIRYTYDACGRVTETVHPTHGRSTWRYDLAGRVIATWSRFLGKRRFRYDAAGQLVEAVDALGRATRYTYDVGGRAVEITDPLGHVTRRGFNHLDLNIEEIDPLGRVKRYRYDTAGRLIGHERATGERLDWTHDGAGNVQQIITDGVVVATHRHDYATNTLTIDDATDPEAPVTHWLRWDHAGRLVEQARDDATTSWGYDALGRCATITAPNGDTTSYRYDSLGQCVSIDTPAGTVTQRFDGAGRLIESVGPTARQAWAYEDGQVARHVTETGKTRQETAIERDADGRITAITRDGDTTHYRHDAAGQLIEARSPSELHTWTYDEAGRLAEERGGEQVIRYVHDAAGQLLERHRDDQVTRYTYNAAGKRIAEDGPDGHTEYSWSALGWLTSIAAPDGVTSLHVNALSELARVNDTALFWNHTGPLQVGDQTITATSAGTAIGGTWHSASWRTGRPDTTTGWHTDLAATIDGIGITPTGGLHIAGLEWHTHRAYHPDTRSFLTPDPLEPITASTWVGNPYSYAGNDPLQALDPLGLRPVTDEELRDYTHRRHTGSFWERNGTAVGGAVIAAAGLGIMFLPIPGAQIIGGAVMSGGINMAQQGFQNPGKPPDMWQVGINAAFGALGGGVAVGLKAIGGRAAAFAANRWGQTAIGVGTGTAGGAADGAYVAARDGLTGNDFWGSVGTSALWGGITGGVTSFVTFRNSPSPAGGDTSMVPTGPVQDGVVPLENGLVVPRSALPAEVAVPPAPRPALSEPLPPGWVQAESGLIVPQSAAPHITPPRPIGPPPPPPAGYTYTDSGLLVKAP